MLLSKRYELEFPVGIPIRAARFYPLAALGYASVNTRGGHRLKHPECSLREPGNRASVVGNRFLNCCSSGTPEFCSRRICLSRTKGYGAGGAPISVTLSIGVAAAATSGVRQLCDDRFPSAHAIG